jgi:hypothetical protein
MVGTAQVRLCPPYETLAVIARSDSDEAIHLSASEELDCFATLAMTRLARSR